MPDPQSSGTAGRPLNCPRCASPASVVEEIRARLDWGPAVIGADGLVRPRDLHRHVPIVNGENSTPTGVRGVCDSAACGHEWALRRHFVVPIVP